MKSLNKILSIILMLILSNSAIAMDVQSYEKLKNSSIDILKVYINGVGYGYSWINSILESQERPPLYCPPRKIALNVENYLAVIDDEIKKASQPLPPDTPIELILYFGLVESFPCSN